MQGLKDTVSKNVHCFRDKQVLKSIITQLDEATSLRIHLRDNADFYRRQRILDNGLRYPTHPEEQVSNHDFIRFWMSKLDFKQKSFKKVPVGHSFKLETLLKIALAFIITERMNL